MAPCSYTDDEMLTFIALIKETDSFRQLDGRIVRNAVVFTDLARQTAERHPACPAKTGEQWRLKWKGLRKKFLDEKQDASKSGKIII